MTVFIRYKNTAMDDGYHQAPYDSVEHAKPQYDHDAERGIEVIGIFDEDGNEVTVDE